MFKEKSAKAVLLVVAALAGCSSASGPMFSADNVTLSNGEQAYRVGCHGLLGGESVCRKKAEEICGDKAVRTLQGNAPLGARTSDGKPDTNVLLFQCGVPEVATQEGKPAKPAPESAPVPAKRVTLAADANFDTAKADLKARGREQLDRLIHDAEGMNLRAVTINGFTDAQGTAEYNQRLSERRAQAVAQYLQAHGLKVQRYEVHGFGKENPVASNTTAAGRAQNRRVEIILEPAM